MTEHHEEQMNVLGTPLQSCCTDPVTGFYRTGFCETGPQDAGIHVVCTIVTDEFLAFSKSRGNDLTSPAPQYGFAGLKEGDKWCLCARRWTEALENGCAPSIILEATHKDMLQYADIEILKKYAVKP